VRNFAIVRHLSAPISPSILWVLLVSVLQWGNQRV